jgi:predicted MFS family arabinose efflux permease
MENNTTTDLAIAPAWNAMFAISIAVSGLIISEFLPVSLLIPIAKELRVAEGMAGEAISVTAIVALVASILTPVGLRGPGVIAGSTVLFKHNAIVVSCLIALWGLFFGLVQIGWNIWFTRVVPDEAESGGGILVAVIKSSIMAGAGTGGYCFDSFGAEANYLLGSLIAISASLMGTVAFRQVVHPKEAEK